MKHSNTVTSSRRKQRKAHFSATSIEKRVRMGVHLSKELREKFKVRRHSRTAAVAAAGLC